MLNASGAMFSFGIDQENQIGYFYISDCFRTIRLDFSIKNPEKYKNSYEKALKLQTAFQLFREYLAIEFKKLESQ